MPFWLIEYCKAKKVLNIYLNLTYNQMKVKVTQLCSTPYNTWTVTLQTSLCVGFSRQEHWSWLPCLSPSNLPQPRIKVTSPALYAGNEVYFIWSVTLLQRKYFDQLFLFCIKNLHTLIYLSCQHIHFFFSVLPLEYMCVCIYIYTCI